MQGREVPVKDVGACLICLPLTIANNACRFTLAQRQCRKKHHNGSLRNPPLPWWARYSPHHLAMSKSSQRLRLCAGEEYQHPHHNQRKLRSRVLRSSRSQTEILLRRLIPMLWPRQKTSCRIDSRH